MSGLVVGGTIIPIAVSSPSFTRSEAVDRGRLFDGTGYASQTGGAADEWQFSTPPVSQALAAEYRAVLGRVPAQLCSGDILEQPKMCHTQLSGGNPLRKAVGHNVVLNFTLSEVQPANVLLRYAPGDTITGESFSRSTVAYLRNASGGLEQVAINAKRHAHYIGGVATLLLEDTRTNHLLWSSDFSNAAWTKTTMTVGTGLPDLTGGTGACTLTATGADASVQQTLATGASIVRTNSIWMRRRTGTGAVHLYESNPGSGNRITPTLTSDWQRVSIPNAAASINRSFLLILAVSGDAIDVFIAQMEDGEFKSSEIPTTTAAVTRGADSYSLPFTTPPQEMTVYAKFVELGTGLAGQYLWEVSDPTDGNPRFLVWSSGGQYQVYHAEPSLAVQSTQGAASSLGNVVEIAAPLHGDGSVSITQSINGAAETLGTPNPSGPNLLGALWSGQLVWLNSRGTISAGFIALQSFKIVAGARSLADMRAA